MEDKNQILLNFILNDPKHLKKHIDTLSPFKSQKKNQKPLNQKALFKGNFYCYYKQNNQYKNFYFELYPNLILKYNDKNKTPSAEYLLLQYCQIFQESEVLGESVAFTIILETENEICRLITDKYQQHKLWSKCIRKYCRVPNFLGRYKVDCRIYEHFYRCIDKKKRIYSAN
ncbi:hypothetical protein PPERSA_10529 [Pseudocohnilembus persalinus]|uniref:PH domain-containing protein n=1 Tax=Pseudocohnilembus persalinus TaxID=266149 RepID=A0A0V0R7G5_PSEPJ|nr:hypothetical protein PPERSA_10529 [Pseudocohnilembus persalinus]|eukprot:KRX10430.1 hypothetical protein PPERSA_10529 [Pseudocohnilembus persalinus]